MLGSMRTLSKSIVSKLLMLLLIVSFGVWGVGDILKSGGSASYAAKVGSETVTMGEFQRQNQLIARQFQAVGIKEIPEERVKLASIRQLVTEKLTLLAMRDMGLYVNQETIGRSLAAMPEFQDEHGRFSKARYKFTLDKQRLNEKQFLNDYQRELTGRFLSDSLSMTDAVAPASVLTLQATSAGETRDVVLLTIPAATAPEESSEDALMTYYDAHKQTDYMRPETRDLEYVVLTDAEINTLVSKAVTDDAVTQAMTERKKTDKAALRIQLEKEQRDDVMRDLSNTVEDELAAGKTIGEAFAKAGIKTEPHTLTNAMAETAKTSSDDVTRTVVEQGFGLSEGEISHLITSKKGALLMVSARKINGTSPKPFEAVKADVRSHVAKQLAADAARTKAQSVKDALSTSTDWQKIASEQKVATRTVNRVGHAMDGRAPVDGIPPALQESIFQHKVNEVAGPMTLSNGDQALAFITASHLPQLSASDLKPTKETAAMSQLLGKNVEAHAYQAFSEKHHVDINPAIMQAQGEVE